jgi:creatinine amidohydrolase/Fe(II)-dependent formamide hydrolase-like protein
MKFHAHALILGLLLLAPVAVAQTPHAGVTLEGLTWTELRDRISGGATTILVPIGGTEQNGPHMTLGKHNVRVKVLADRIATTLGNALVAPVIAYTPESASHLRFPGTITISDAAFEAVLESAARSLRQAGFRDIVFLGDHGSYQKDLQVAAAILNGEWKTTNTRAHAIVDYYAAAGAPYGQALKERGYGDDEIGTHAGLADTSLALAVDPTLVRSGHLQTGAKLTSADGVYGDPRRASAELGKIGVDMIVARTVDAIRKAIAQR